MSFAYSKNIINNPKLSIDDFKSYCINHSYNDNMFNTDGSINPNYNSNKKTGLISQILEDGWSSMPIKDKNNILKYRPNADIKINKVIDCHNKNLGCSVYECPNCHDFVFIGHTCKSRFCSSCGYKYKLERVNNILNTAYNCNHRQLVFTCARELWPYFLLNFDLIDTLYEAVNKTIYSILNDSFKSVKGKLDIPLDSFLFSLSGKIVIIFALNVVFTNVILLTVNLLEVFIIFIEKIKKIILGNFQK